MSDKNKNPHKNHRSRLRETVRKTGIENMPDHNILELLLFYSIPRIDTNELAHKLINRFGSLQRVLDADYEQLLEVDGIGESSALLISSIRGIVKKYIDGGFASKISLIEPDDVKDFLFKKYYGVNEEVFYLICLDCTGNLINCFELGRGTAKSVVLDKREIVALAINSKADMVIFAHNHPNGVAAPSREDIIFTEEASNLLSEIGIRVADHFILAGNEAISLASVDKFKGLFR